MGLKQALFNIYAKNFYDYVYWWASQRVEEELDKNTLQFVHPEVDEAVPIEKNNFFRCPICKRFFSPDNPSKIDFNKLGLTEEHVPPECMGDLIKTMTCKPCNTLLGSYEGDVEKSLRRKDKLEKEGITRARISFEDKIQEIGVDFQLKDKDTVHLHTVEKATHMEALRELEERLSDGFKFTVHISLPEVNDRKLLGILYKNAFLTAFYVYGYAYVESPSVQQVRSQILDFEREIIPTKSIVKLNKVPEDISYPLIGWSSDPLKALYVVFPLEIEENKKLFAVPLPGPGSQKVFSNFINSTNRRESGERANFSLDFPYEVLAGDSLEIVEQYGTLAAYKFWGNIS